MRRVKFLIPSILSLLNILFVPVFDIWGGLFPSDPDENFFGVIETIFTDSDAFHYWSVVIVVSILIPAIAMLIGAVIDNKPVFLVASLVGILLWFRFVISFVHQYELSDLFDFDDGNISIGSWIALVLFVVSFIIAITSSNNKQNPNEFASNFQGVARISRNNNKPQKVQTDNSLNQVSISYGTFCPNCGAKQDKPSKFCGKCGYKFE